MTSFLAPAITGMMAGLGVAVPLGAVGILVVGEGMARGLGAGLRAAGGVALTDLLYAALAVAVGTSVTPAIRPYSRQLEIAGGLALVVIAVQGVRARNPGEQPHGVSAPGRLPVMARFALLTVINPLTAIYFTVLVLGPDGPAAGQVASGVIFVTAVGISSLAWQAVLAAVGACAGRRLSDRSRYWTALVGYGLVFTSGLRLLL